MFEQIRNKVKNLINNRDVEEINNKTDNKNMGIYMIYIDNFNDDKIIPIYRHPFGILSKINLTLNDDDNDSGNKNNIGVKTDVISYDFLLEKPVFALNRSHNFIEGATVDKLSNLYIYEPIMVNLLAANKIKALGKKIKVEWFWALKELTPKPGGNGNRAK